MQLTALIGTKKYQKHGFLQDGKRVPLTAVFVAGNAITQIKTADKEGYNSLQLGINPNKKARKSLKNHASKAGLQETPRFLKEIKVEDLEGAVLGSQINVSEIFTPGDTVDVTGISKGKGWAGGVKRWGFHGGPRTHGQSDRERAPGSIGQTTTPGRVYRGKKMAGRMGSDTVTVKNLEVIEVTDDGVLLIKGLIPGNVNGLVIVKKTGTNKKFIPLYKEQESVITSESPSVSEDASQTKNVEPSSEPAQLSESQPTDSADNQETKPEAALGSSENVQTSPTASAENTEETKEEVKEDAS